MAARWLFLASLALVTGPNADPEARQHDIASAIRGITAGAAAAPLIIDAAPAAAPASLRRFYAARSWAPAWLTVDGQPRIAELVRAIRNAGQQGLDPSAYRQTAIERRLAALAAGPTDAHALALLDVLLTDAYLALATHRAVGRIDPRVVHPHWTLPRPPFDAAASLRAALGPVGIERALDAVDPDHPQFVGLRAALARERARERIAWPVLPDGPALREGDAGERVRVLRNRLALEEFPATPAAPGGPGRPDPARHFDADLKARVQAFQSRHGLEQDGIVGRETRAALNLTPARRAGQIALNMERLRWLPALDDPRIEINIPAFTLRVIENDRTALAMRVIVGRTDWPTPVFNAVVTGIVLNPYWNVPASILTREILPVVVRDPAWLARHDMEILSASGAIVPRSAIDWSDVSVGRFPYRVRQRPGEENPLGRLKFVLAPLFLAVALHDTPARHLFAESRRDFSHGCVRLEDPLGLAAFVQRRDTTWTPEHVRQAPARVETAVAVRDPIPVLFLYSTAFVDETGEVHFRADVYGHDRALDRAVSMTHSHAADNGDYRTTTVAFMNGCGSQ